MTYVYEAVKRIPTLSRSRCRETFEARFSAQRMCRDYLSAYEQVAEQARPRAA